MTFRPALIVHVVWHPRCGDAATIAQRMFHTLCAWPERPSASRLGLPVRLWTGDADAPDSPPPPLPPERADRSLVVALVDIEWLSSEQWVGWLRDEHERLAASDVHDLLIVGLTESVTSFDENFTRSNMVRAWDLDPSRLERGVTNAILHNLCRHLADDDAPVAVFLSHAKVDGESLARSVQRHLSEETQLGKFFDTNDIAQGSTFADVIDEAIAAPDTAMLVIRTDAYSSRAWCRREVLRAKELMVPMVVLDATRRGPSRAFPYLGNARIITMPSEVVFEPEGEIPDLPVDLGDRLVGATLRTVLRHRYFRHRVDDLTSLSGRTPAWTVFPRAPELLTVLHHQNRLTARVAANDENQAAFDESTLEEPKKTSKRKKQKNKKQKNKKHENNKIRDTIVYPDPPLGAEELDVLRSAVPGFEFRTPLELFTE